MDEITPIEAEFNEIWRSLGTAPGPCVVAVSGGPDSVALLRLAVHVAEPLGLEVAHFDHGWRETSAQDAQFVEALAERLGVPCTVARCPQDSRRLDEAGGREARYAFLKRVAEQRGARYLLVGHTADDQVETVLHRMVRGTGVRGLAGMKPFRSLGPALTIVRPLLRVCHSDVVNYLHRLGQDFLDDPSNADVNYTRVRIRHVLLPSLVADYNPQIATAILRLAQSARAAQDEIDRLVSEQLARGNVQFESGSACIPVDEWRGTSNFLVCEMLAFLWRQAGWPEQGMGQSEWQRLASMVRTPSPACAVFPGEVVAIRDDRTLVLTRRNQHSYDLAVSAPPRS